MAHPRMMDWSNFPRNSCQHIMDANLRQQCKEHFGLGLAPFNSNPSPFPSSLFTWNNQEEIKFHKRQHRQQQLGHFNSNPSPLWTTQQQIEHLSTPMPCQHNFYDLQQRLERLRTPTTNKEEQEDKLKVLIEDIKWRYGYSHRDCAQYGQTMRRQAEELLADGNKADQLVRSTRISKKNREEAKKKQEVSPSVHTRWSSAVGNNDFTPYTHLKSISKKNKHYYGYQPYDSSTTQWIQFDPSKPVTKGS